MTKHAFITTIGIILASVYSDSYAQKTAVQPKSHAQPKSLVQPKSAMQPKSFGKSGVGNSNLIAQPLKDKGTPAIPPPSRVCNCICSIDNQTTHQMTQIATIPIANSACNNGSISTCRSACDNRAAQHQIYTNPQAACAAANNTIGTHIFNAKSRAETTPPIPGATNVFGAGPGSSGLEKRVACSKDCGTDGLFLNNTCYVPPTSFAGAPVTIFMPYSIRNGSLNHVQAPGAASCPNNMPNMNGYCWGIVTSLAGAPNWSLSDGYYVSNGNLKRKFGPIPSSGCPQGSVAGNDGKCHETVDPSQPLEHYTQTGTYYPIGNHPSWGALNMTGDSRVRKRMGQMTASCSSDYTFSNGVCEKAISPSSVLNEYSGNNLNIGTWGIVHGTAPNNKRVYKMLTTPAPITGAFL